MSRGDSCKLTHDNKHIAYGQRYDRGNWCPACDLHYAKDINKKRERQEAKKEIRKELDHD